MSAYIPQVSSDSIAYPLIACNVDEIKECGLFEWEDPRRTYEYYDITKDVDRLLDFDGVEKTRILFSKMVHWPFQSSSRGECYHDYEE